MVAGRVAWEATRNRPANQYAVKLQPQIPVQAAGMVLMDDKRVVRARLGGRNRNGLRGTGRIAFAAVLVQAITHIGTVTPISAGCGVASTRHRRSAGGT